MVTDSQDKGKDSVYTFLTQLFDQICHGKDTAFDEKDTIVIYTDGPSSEFKNKYMVKVVNLLSKKYKCKVMWKYFATSHGKGVVD